MMSRLLVLASLASTLFLVTPMVFAASTDGVYLGIGSGFSSLQNDREEVDESTASSGRDSMLDNVNNTWKGFVGYQFTPFLVRTEYERYGFDSDDKRKSFSSSIGLSF